MLKIITNLRILPRWVVIALDSSIILAACVLAYLLRFNFHLDARIWHDLVEGSLVYAVFGFLSIIISRSYRGIIRYTGLQDGIQILQTTALNSMLVVAFNLLAVPFIEFSQIPYSVILISFLASFLFLFNYRLLVKEVFLFYKRSVLDRINVLIFGAGQSGIIAKHVIESTSQFKVVGFLEDDDHKIGKIINGSTIYSGVDNLKKTFEKLRVDELIIAIQNVTIERKNQIVDACLGSQVKVRVVPPVKKWVNGELSIRQIKEVDIDELLGRESIRLNNEFLNKDIEGKVILITGAAGSIGTELVRQVFACKPRVLVLVDQAESDLFDIEQELLKSKQFTRLVPIIADISDGNRMRSILSTYRPEIVFHAAAYKHVPMMEANPYEAINTNIFGTKNIADLAVEFNVNKFVMISTDKAVNPTNVMGCSKRIAEMYVQALNQHMRLKDSQSTAFVTTRFGNVLGSNGSVIPSFKKQIESGGPITVTHPEITRYFMTIPEACELVLEAASMGHGGEIFIFDMGKAIRIHDLAKKMVLLSGLQLGRDIEIVFTGLREGEKLYEELLTRKENTIPTHHEKILIAKVPQYEFTELKTKLTLLQNALSHADELQLVLMMKQIVPEFKSNHSRYGILDGFETAAEKSMK